MKQARAEGNPLDAASGLIPVEWDKPEIVPPVKIRVVRD
jgi:hypothetical protein